VSWKSRCTNRNLMIVFMLKIIVKREAWCNMCFVQRATPQYFAKTKHNSCKMACHDHHYLLPDLPQPLMGNFNNWGMLWYVYWWKETAQIHIFAQRKSFTAPTLVLLVMCPWTPLLLNSPTGYEVLPWPSPLSTSFGGLYGFKNCHRWWWCHDLLSNDSSHLSHGFIP
jgi:hypothetical protein